jgi:hypothetical protein
METLSRSKLLSVEVNANGATLESSVPRPLFESGYINLSFSHTGNWNTYAVSADGQRFLVPRPESSLTGELNSTPITVVLNWTAGLKK